LLFFFSPQWRSLLPRLVFGLRGKKGKNERRRESVKIETQRRQTTVQKTRGEAVTNNRPKGKVESEVRKVREKEYERDKGGIYEDRVRQLA